MKITNAALVDLKGRPLKQNAPGQPTQDSDPELLVSDVLLTAALMPAANGVYEPSKAAERYKFAKTLVDAKVGDGIEVPANIAVELDRDICRNYAVVVSGQMHELLK
jgi:hypothetical protein